MIVFCQMTDIKCGFVEFNLDSYFHSELIKTNVFLQSIYPGTIIVDACAEISSDKKLIF